MPFSDACPNCCILSYRIKPGSNVFVLVVFFWDHLRRHARAARLTYLDEPQHCCKAQGNRNDKSSFYTFRFGGINRTSYRRICTIASRQNRLNRVGGLLAIDASLAQQIAEYNVVRAALNMGQFVRTLFLGYKDKGSLGLR